MRHATLTVAATSWGSGFIDDVERITASLLLAEHGSIIYSFIHYFKSALTAFLSAKSVPCGKYKRVGIDNMPRHSTDRVEVFTS